MKRFVCVILALTILFSSTCFVHADTIDTIRVHCISNLSDMKTITLKVKNDNLYISAKNASLLSKYKIEKSDKTNVVFVRGTASDSISVKTAFVDEDEYWVGMESTCGKLGVNVCEESGWLLFYGREHTPQDLITYTNTLMQNDVVLHGSYADHSFKGNLGYVSAVLYGTIGEFNPIERVSGVYTSDQYREIFSDLCNIMVQGNSTKNNFSILGEDKSVPSITDAMAVSKYIEEIEALNIEQNYNGKSPDEVSMLLSKWGLSDPDVDTYKVTGAINAINDPADAIFKKIVSGKAGKGSALSSATIGGLDVVNQIDLYRYIKSVSACSSLLFDMIDYSYFGENGYKDYAPSLATRYIQEIHDCYESKYKAVLEEEILDTLTKTASSTGESLLMDALFGEEAATIGLAMNVIRLCYDKAFGNITEKTKQIEKSRLIEDLETGLVRSYSKYQSSKNLTAIDAKYLTLLLLCYQTLDFYNWMEDEDGDFDCYPVVSDWIEALLLYSDFDLCRDIEPIKNDKIVLDSLEQVPVYSSDDYDALYADVLEKYAVIAGYGNDHERIINYFERTLANNDSFDVSLMCTVNNNIGYQYLDVDGDGICELLIGALDGNCDDNLWLENIIYDMYTIRNGTAKGVRILVGSPFDEPVYLQSTGMGLGVRYALLDDNTIVCHSHYGVPGNYIGVYTFLAGNIKETAGWDYLDNENEYSKMYDKLSSRTVPLDLTPFSVSTTVKKPRPVSLDAEKYCLIDYIGMTVGEVADIWGDDYSYL